MEGKAWDYMVLCVLGIGYYNRWVSGSARTAAPRFLLAPLFKSVTCFR